MEPIKKQTAIFYLKKDEGILYINKLSRPITVNFPKDVIDNLEVINKEKLQIFIQSFIKKHNILPTKMLFVLDKNVTFEKDIEGNSSFEQDEETGKFLDIVPFEKLLSRVFKKKENTKVIATNRELCEELMNSFEQEKFTVSAVVPVSMLDEIIPPLKKEFDGKLALSKIATLKHYSLLETPDNQEKLIKYEKPEVKSRQFIALVSTFALLLVILVILIFTQVFMSSPKKTSTIKQSVRVPQATVSASLKPTPTQ